MLMNINVRTVYVFLVHGDSKTMNILSIDTHTCMHTLCYMYICVSTCMHICSYLSFVYPSIRLTMLLVSIYWVL